MERAVYCYGWLPGRPNCHPVHTMKHIGMVEDMERAGATMLCWSMMGSGALSLPFLERQITGEVPPQLRFHGYLNDREFNEECLARGILPYAVVYQAQGWEFPARLSGDGREIMEMNLMRSAPNAQYGLGEFTRDEHWELFGKRFSDYFPGGLTNSDGEKVADLWEECATRDLYGRATHSHWVEVDSLPQTCHGMCRNNPVWRSYLKKTIEIQLDAGARAIQLDESETPICSMGFGGCFCKDCMKLFREFLKRKAREGALPAELEGVDLDAFDYTALLRERRTDWPKDFYNIPLSGLYWEFQVETQNRYFREIADYARACALEKWNSQIKISGNFTNMHLLYYPSLDAVDVCVTELRRTILRRHNWLRLAAGYVQNKPLVLAESPYDGFMPKFVELVREGKADDYYRLFMMEVAAHGCSMAFPYGAWMGNATCDSFHAPKKAGAEVQDFLAENDRLITKDSLANVLVLYGYASYMTRDFQSGQGENLAVGNRDDLMSYSVTYDERAARMPFFDITEQMTKKRVPFDVRILGDGALVPDELDEALLNRYDLVVVPDLDILTENQARLLTRYAQNKPLLAYGRFAENLPGAWEALAEAPKAVAMAEGKDFPRSVEMFARKVHAAYEAARVLDWDNENIHAQANLIGDGVCVHLLNYAYDVANHRTIPQTVTVEVLARAGCSVRALTLDGRPLRLDTLSASPDTLTRVRLYDVPAYAALVIE